ncbi:hypothetical protein LSTR_LSTR007999 [Laodelphax striatellus]|uniref:Uncharacterized protein n=1 Tax=Laodelphax striatellus TaxID=195883 RepID=A0A482WK88_LAOST|nr:hypothetical protein LSTR_LSTR007999 [Laodelphax striatellus]
MKMQRKRYDSVQNMVVCLERLKMGRMSASKLKKIDSNRRICELNVSRLMNLRQAQDGCVTYLDLDGYNGRYLLSACHSGSIYIHDLANDTGNLRFESQVIAECSPGHAEYSSARLETAQWYPLDPGLFTTSGGNSRLRIWDANQMTVVETVDVKETINRHHMSPVPSEASCLIAVATVSEFVYLVDIRTGNSVRELRGHELAVNACAFSPIDGDLLVTGDLEGRLLLWDVRMSRGHLLEMPREKPPKKDFVKSVCFSGDGQSVIFVSKSSKIRLWKLFGCKKHGGKVSEFSGQARGKTIRIQMDVSGDFDFIFIPDNRSVAIYSLKTLKLVNSLDVHYGLVNCCRFNKFTPELYSAGMDQNIVPYRAEGEISRGFTVDLERDGDVVEERVVKNKFVHDSLWNDSDSD